MFLKELWVYNKKLLIAFLLVILLWGFINYKQGAIAAPLFQYGMYSTKFFISDTQQVTQLYVNNKRLDFTKYTIADRDLLQSSLDYYSTQKSVNENSFFTIKKILSRVYIGKFMKEEKYTNNITDKQFTEWYCKLAEKIVGFPITTLTAYQQKYVWKNDRLVPVFAPLKIDYLEFNR